MVTSNIPYLKARPHYSQHVEQPPVWTVHRHVTCQAIASYRYLQSHEVRYSATTLMGRNWVLKTTAEKIRRFRFFRPISPNSTIAGPSNSQYCEFEGPAIVMEEKWVTKIAAKKNGKCQQGVEKNVFRPEARLTGQQTQSTKRIIYVSCMRSSSLLRCHLAFLWCLPTLSWTGWRSQLASFDVIRPLDLSSTRGFLRCSTHRHI